MSIYEVKFHSIRIVVVFFLSRQANELFARAALHCLSTITLRSKENSQALFDVGAAETIVETMKLHPTSKIVQVHLNAMFAFFMKNNSIFHRFVAQWSMGHQKYGVTIKRSMFRILVTWR